MIRILILLSVNLFGFYCQSDYNIETSVADPVVVPTSQPLYYEFSSTDKIETSVAPPVLVTTTAPIYYDFTLPDKIETSKAKPIFITTTSPIYFDFSTDEPQTSVPPPPDLITTTEEIYFDFSSKSQPSTTKLSTLLTSANSNQTLIQLQRQINDIPKLDFSSCNLKNVCVNKCTNVTIDLFNIKDFESFKACLNFELITNNYLITFQLSANITMNNQTVYSDVISVSNTDPNYSISYEVTYSMNHSNMHFNFEKLVLTKNSTLDGCLSIELVYDQNIFFKNELGCFNLAIV